MVFTIVNTIALTLATGHKHLILNKWSNPKTFHTLAFQPSKGRNSEVLASTIATATETCGDYCSIRIRSKHAMTRSQTLARSHSPDEYWKSYYRIRIVCDTIAIVNTIATIAQAYYNVVTASFIRQWASSTIMVFDLQYLV